MAQFFEIGHEIANLATLVDTMPNYLDDDVTKSYRTNTHLCLNVFCIGWHLAVTYSLMQRIS